MTRNEISKWVTSEATRIAKACLSVWNENAQAKDIVIPCFASNFHTDRIIEELAWRLDCKVEREGNGIRIKGKR